MKLINQTIIILFLFVTIILAGCSVNVKEEVTEDTCLDSTVCGLKNNNVSTEINIDKLEIYHFYGTHQCTSCIAVGDLAEETINTYFANELNSGKIVFNHINGDLPENRELVNKYGVTGSSLWLGTYSEDGKFKAEENVNVWYKIKDKQEYMTYLKGIIEQKLAGN